MYEHIHHFQQTSSGGFWQAFLAELLAGIIVTILGATLIPAYLDWRKKPKLEFKNRATRTDTGLLTRAQDGCWEGSFGLVIRNDGPTSQKDVFWHMLIPEDLRPEINPYDPARVARPGSERLVGMGKNWRHFLGKIEDPIFAHKGLIFPHEIKVKSLSRDPETYPIYYYFSSEFGTSPARAEKFHEIERALGRDADAAFKPEYLSKLTLKPEE